MQFIGSYTLATSEGDLRKQEWYRGPSNFQQCLVVWYWKYFHWYLALDWALYKHFYFLKNKWLVQSAKMMSRKKRMTSTTACTFENFIWIFSLQDKWLPLGLRVAPTDHQCHTHVSLSFFPSLLSSPLSFFLFLYLSLFLFLSFVFRATGPLQAKAMKRCVLYTFCTSPVEGCMPSSIPT